MIRKTATSSVSIAVTTDEHCPTPEVWAAHAAAYVAENLPMTMDETTTWTAVAVVGPTIVNIFTVDLTRGTPTTSIIDKQRAAMRDACSNDALRRFLKIGGSMCYVFKSTTGEPLDVFEIDEISCTKKSFEQRCHGHQDRLQPSQTSAPRQRNQYH